MIETSKKLRAAFPELPPEFYDILQDRLKDNGFNDERLKAAVNNVIDTCIYPRPTIANIIDFDKTVTTYSWQDIADMASGGTDIFSKYKRLESGRYVSKYDAEKFSL